MQSFPPPGFTGSPLVRVDNERDHPDYFAAALANPAARMMILDGLNPHVDEAGRLGWRPIEAGDSAAELALLGLIDDAPCFVPLTEIREDSSQRSAAMNAALNLLVAEDAATYAIARCLIDWHARHPFCPRCGTRTRAMRSGWARLCDRATAGCGTEHYPRTDPVVIMLAEYEERILVGRQSRWPKGRYSALAGFVEVGESIEEAVARELFEEAGVRATAVRYVASQPWPFPSQLMIACIAQVESPELALQVAEIEHAIWVDRDEVRAALAGEPDAPFLTPPPYAIANTLLTSWAS